jgi:phosphoglycolate phosphatase-like HAD superfamily hydrolase
VRRLGTRIVAYTEAPVYNVTHRLELLGISGEIDFIYAPPGKGRIGYSPGKSVPPLPTSKIRFLPSNHRKPDPAVLIDISREQSVPTIETVYVGDSLLRDAAMANRAGVKSVWARYGTEVEADLWRQLIRVTHWTVANVANEERLRVEYKDTRPDPTIDSFDALLSHFHFVSPVTQIAGTKASQLEIE